MCIIGRLHYYNLANAEWMCLFMSPFSLTSLNQTLIVAEIGNNHEGNISVAKEMVHAVAESGADVVKFQTFQTAYFINPENEARYQRLKGFELSYDQFAELAVLARSLGLMFISTPLDLDSAIFLNGIVDFFKVASSDNTFYPLLDYIAQTDKAMVVSTGLADLPVVSQTVEYIKRVRHDRALELALLHCVTSYPVPPEQANLRAIRVLQDQFPDVVIGYSDHTMGNLACVLSVAFGVNIIEKHFTLDHHYSDFRDHQLSATPNEMRELVHQVRQAEVLLGTFDKQLQEVEVGVVSALRRSIVAKHDLPSGHTLQMSDLAWTRPGDGLAAGQEEHVLGKTLAVDLKQGQRISVTDFA